MTKDFQEIHRLACEQGRPFYMDPDSGFKVFTELYHRERGSCCNSACRHCPYENASRTAGK